MTDFKPGDIVRMTKGDPDKPGYGCQVREVTSGDWCTVGVSPSGLRTFENAGWEVDLIERPLPTKPNTLGWATMHGERCIVRRKDVGTWSVYDESGFAYVVPDEDLSDFTEAVLIPKDLADKVMEWTADPFRRGVTIGATLNRIADHLKGQDDE